MRWIIRRARGRVIDGELHVFAHAGRFLLLLDGREKLAILLERLPVDARNIGLDLGNADRIIAQVKPEIVRRACGFRSEKIVGEGAESSLLRLSVSSPPVSTAPKSTYEVDGKWR